MMKKKSSFGVFLWQFKEEIKDMRPASGGGNKFRHENGGPAYNRVRITESSFCYEPEEKNFILHYFNDFAGSSLPDWISAK